MKVLIECDTESVSGTKVSFDGVPQSHIKWVSLSHLAGHKPALTVEVLKLRNGVPYYDPDIEGVPTEVIYG